MYYDPAERAEGEDNLRSWTNGIRDAFGPDIYDLIVDNKKKKGGGPGEPPTPSDTPEFISPEAGREVLANGLSTVESALGDIPEEDLDNLDEQDSEALNKVNDLLDSAQEAIDSIDPVGSDTNDLRFDQARADLGEIAQILSESNNGDMQNAGFDLKEKIDEFINLPQIDFGGGRAERASRETDAPNVIAREDIRWDDASGVYTDVNGNQLTADQVDAAGLDSTLRNAPAADIQVINADDGDTRNLPTEQDYMDDPAIDSIIDAMVWDEEQEQDDPFSNLRESDPKTFDLFKDIYEGASDREVEVRMALDELYKIPFGRGYEDPTTGEFLGQDDIAGLIKKYDTELQDIRSGKVTPTPTDGPGGAPAITRENVRWDNAKGVYTDADGNELTADQVDAAGLDSTLRTAPESGIEELGPQSLDLVETAMPDFLTEQFDSMFNTPDGAHKVNMFDMYEPEGRTDQASADFTDDPQVLSQKFTKEELTVALADAVLAKDGGDASGYGNLPFENGDEPVKAEAIYDALSMSAQENPEKILSDIYDSALPAGSETNAEKLAQRQSDDSLFDGSDPGLVPVSIFDSGFVDVVERNGALGTPSKTQNSVDLMKVHEETNPKIKSIADDLKAFQDSGEQGDGENLEPTLEKYLPLAYSADPDDQAAFRGYWGMLMSLDGGASEPDDYKRSSGFRSTLFGAIQKQSGAKTEDEALAAYNEFIDNFGGFSDFVDDKGAIADGFEDLNAESVASDFFRLVKESARPNEEKLFRIIGVSTENQELLDQYITVGNSVGFDPRPFSTTDTTEGTFLDSLTWDPGKASHRVVFVAEPGAIDSIDATSVSWFPGENEHVGYGQVEIKSVRRQPSGIPNRPDEYIIEIGRTEATPDDIAGAQSAEAEALGVFNLESYDVSEWRKTGGQAGSNEGGFYEDADGNAYYVKVPKSQSHADNEVLASVLYEALGVPSAQVRTGDNNGDLRIVSKIVDGSQADFADKVRSGDVEYLDKLRADFAIDAWLANWDVTGTGFDNVVTDVNGDPARVDPGGSLMWRAQGEPKGGLFGDTVGEIDTLRDEQMSPFGSRVFGSMTDDDVRESAKKLLNIEPSRIDQIVNSVVADPEEAALLAQRLKARRQDILDRFGLTDADKDDLLGKPVPLTNSIGFEAQDLQAGDILGKDSFVIESVSTDENGKTTVTGYYPGHESQTKQWNQTDVVDAARGSTVPPKGTNPAIKAPKKPRTPTQPAFQGDIATQIANARDWAEVRDILKDREIVFFDYETTGFGPGNGNQPVQLGAVKVRNGQVVDRFNLFMDPTEELSDWSRDNLKNGDGNPLTDEFLSQQIGMGEAHALFADWMGEDPIIAAHNLPFDREILERVAADANVNVKPAGYIDTLSLSRVLVDKQSDDNPNGTPSHSLKQLMDHQGLEFGAWHTADADSEASANLFNSILDGAINDPNGNNRLGVVNDQQSQFEKNMADHQAAVEAYQDALAKYNMEVAIAAAWNCGGSGLIASVGEGNGPCSVPSVDDLIDSSTIKPGELSDPEAITSGNPSVANDGSNDPVDTAPAAKELTPEQIEERNQNIDESFTVVADQVEMILDPEQFKLKNVLKKNLEKARDDVADVRKKLESGEITEEEAVALLQSILDALPTVNSGADATATDVEIGVFQDSIGDLRDALDITKMPVDYGRPVGPGLPPPELGPDFGYSKDGVFLVPGSRVRDKFGYLGTVVRYQENGWIGIYYKRDVDGEISLKNIKQLTSVPDNGDLRPWIYDPKIGEGKRPDNWRELVTPEEMAAADAAAKAKPSKAVKTPAMAAKKTVSDKPPAPAPANNNTNVTEAEAQSAANRVNERIRDSGNEDYASATSESFLQDLDDEMKLAEPGDKYLMVKLDYEVNISIEDARVLLNYYLGKSYPPKVDAPQGATEAPEATPVFTTKESDVDAADIEPDWQTMPPPTTIKDFVDKLNNLYDGLDFVMVSDKFDEYYGLGLQLIDYQNQQYTSINDNLRKGYSVAATLDKVFDNAPTLPEDVVLYRGVSSAYADELIASYDVGDMFTDLGYSSTSISRQEIGSFAKYSSGESAVTLEIVAPKGTKGVYLNSFLGNSSQYKSELEVLLDRGTTFRVISRTEGVNGNFVAMRVAVVNQDRDIELPEPEPELPEAEAEVPELSDNEKKFSDPASFAESVTARVGDKPYSPWALTSEDAIWDINVPIYEGRPVIVNFDGKDTTFQIETLVFDKDTNQFIVKTYVPGQPGIQDIPLKDLKPVKPVDTSAIAPWKDMSYDPDYADNSSLRSNVELLMAEDRFEDAGKLASEYHHALNGHIEKAMAEAIDRGDDVSSYPTLVRYQELQASVNNRFGPEPLSSYFNPVQNASQGRSMADDLVKDFKKGWASQEPEFDVDLSGRPRPEIEDPKPISASSFDGVNSLMDAVEKSRDTSNTRVFHSAAIDGGDVEDFEVRSSITVSSDTGEKKLRLKFKLTAWAGQEKSEQAAAEYAGTKPPSEGVTWTTEDVIRIPRSRILEDGTIQVTSYNSFNSLLTFGAAESARTITGTLDVSTGKATISILRGNQDNSLKPVNGEGTAQAFHNMVTIDLPIDATEEDIKKALENAGVKDVRATEPADVKILAENRLLSVFARQTDASVNERSQNKRNLLLAQIKNKWGVTADDIVISTDSSGFLTYKMPQEVASKIAEETGATVLEHSVTIYGIRSALTQSMAGSPQKTGFSQLSREEQNDLVASVLADLLSESGGLKATIHRYTEGSEVDGMSSREDIGTGGAAYVFTRAKDHAKSTVNGDDIALIFYDPLRAYQRVDFYANEHDEYGRRFDNHDVIENAKAYFSDSEVMFKNGLSADEGLGMLLSPDMRQRVLKALEERGVKEIGGMPADKFVVDYFDVDIQRGGEVTQTAQFADWINVSGYGAPFTEVMDPFKYTELHDLLANPVANVPGSGHSIVAIDNKLKIIVFSGSENKFYKVDMVTANKPFGQSAGQAQAIDEEELGKIFEDIKKSHGAGEDSNMSDDSLFTDWPGQDGFGDYVPLGVVGLGNETLMRRVEVAVDKMKNGAITPRQTAQYMIKALLTQHGGKTVAFYSAINDIIKQNPELESAIRDLVADVAKPKW
jgi:DNA polymerase III epsilon subunit-like protein